MSMSVRHPNVPEQLTHSELREKKRKRRRRECVNCKGKFYLECAPICPDPPPGERGIFCQPSPPLRRKRCVHCGDLFWLVKDTAPVCPARDEGYKCEPKKLGFAAMDPERRTEVSRKGVETMSSMGYRHSFTSEEAEIYGRKGGKAPHRLRTGRRPKVMTMQ